MPRKKLDPDDINDLRNFTLIDKTSFWKIYKNKGNNDEYLKIVDTGESPKYYIFKKFIHGKDKKD